MSDTSAETDMFTPRQTARLRWAFGRMPYAPLAGYHTGSTPLATFDDLIAVLDNMAEELREVGERNRQREEELNLIKGQLRSAYGLFHLAQTLAVPAELPVENP